MDQYNKVAGQSVITGVDQDRHGNAQGSQFDLAVDGGFAGSTVAVLHLYTSEGFDFGLPSAALKQKGFSVIKWSDVPPSPSELSEALKKCCQLWIISDCSSKLTPAHLQVISAFFNAGHGVYIWGDNDPYYADANQVAKMLFGASMAGNTEGGKTVRIQKPSKKRGLVPNHLITTGLERLYEGITVATVSAEADDLAPLVYGSAGNLIVAVYEKDGKRAIIDGGFTRLFVSWDESGTARYVKNAAAWLANVERLSAVVPTFAGMKGIGAVARPSEPAAFSTMKALRSDRI